VFAIGGGVIEEMTVAEGDRVRKGQRIARLAQPDLEGRLGSARSDLWELRAEHQRLSRFTSTDRSLRDESYALRDQKLKDTIAPPEGRMKAREEQIANQNGLLPPPQVLQARKDYDAARDVLERSRGDLYQLPVDRLAMRAQHEQNLASSLYRISQTERTVEQ